MALTSIGQQKTPGRPTEVTFDADTGLPSDSQEVLLIGHAASGATGTNTVILINNSGDITAAETEANAKFGEGSEMAKMVLAAIAANAGGSTYPKLKACPLAHNETTIPSAAQSAIMAVKAEFVVSCYDMQEDTAERTILKTMALTMSGASRVSNNQFGSFGVAANMDVDDPADLDMVDTQFLIPIWFRDTNTGGSANDYSVGEVAAACAARMAANGVPFNPLNDVTVQGIPASAKLSDRPTVGASLESETALGQGWTCLWTKPNDEVAFVRTVTGRISADGSGTPVVGSYYDVQDFQVLYFWRKTIYTRFSQPDFKLAKASAGVALDIKAEAIRLAVQFEEQEMFQSVAQLAKEFIIERNASDRSRFDLKTPVNVIPGLHVIATNIVAGTRYDVITV